MGAEGEAMQAKRVLNSVLMLLMVMMTQTLQLPFNDDYLTFNHKE
jgi:hypothetical protein